MRQNHVKRRLAAGQASCGTWLSIPSANSAEQMARLGFDWLVVDAEHNAMGIETIAAMFMAMAASPVAPMVRVPAIEEAWFKRVLDAGAWGVVVPMVCSRAEAEAAVAYAKYPPAGKRSVGGGRHALSFDTDPATYYQRANDETVVVAQIEHISAVERADQILSVPGIDACFIGPNDLMTSMGLGQGMDSDHPRFVEAVRHVLRTAQACGVAPGIHTPDAAAAARRVGEGFRFVAIASDARFMAAAARAAVAEISRAGGVARAG